MADIAPAGMASKAWPFQEARKIAKRLGKREDGKAVVFQTGFGPSGLPHIGTFGEVSRTNMVRFAFETMTGRPTKLICFSDDLDGFRRVPENVPDREAMREDLDLPLCNVRDPFGTHESFAAHNNARLRSFLDRFNFDYEFLPSSACYRQGLFDDMLLRVLERFDDVMAIMLPSLGGVSQERTDSYSPFLPVSPKSGRVLQVPTLERNPAKGTIVYEEPDGERMEVSVFGGQVKLQWKPDWAMRWAALSVDYEMYGKDLIPSAELAAKICRALGAQPPAGIAYELFLDADGRKISKSKGSGGVTVDEWLSYATADSLSAYMFQKPGTAKRLFAETVPKTVDEYHRHLQAFPDQEDTARLNNPVWHVHRGHPPRSTMSVPYAMLLNLASAASAESDEVLWGFIRKYEPAASPGSHPDLAAAAKGAVRYFQERILPGRRFRPPDTRERAALAELRSRFWFLPSGTDAEAAQSMVYAVGRKHGFDPMKDWFSAIYEILFGTSQGPRIGGFAAVYGMRETADLIAKRMPSGSTERAGGEDMILPALLYLNGKEDGSAPISDLSAQLEAMLREDAASDGSGTGRSPEAAAEVRRVWTELSEQGGLCSAGLAEMIDGDASVRITSDGRDYIALN